MMRKTVFIAMVFWGFSFLLVLGPQPDVRAAAQPGAAENTKPPLQIVHRTGVKLVVQVNTAATLPNGVSKQIMAVKNLFDEYAALGMKPGKDYEIVIVFRAGGAQFLLNDEAYDRKVSRPHPKGNPNRPMIEAIHAAGAKMYECHFAMKMKGYKPQDLLPFSRMVVTGIGAVVDFEQSGYPLFTP